MNQCAEKDAYDAAYEAACIIAESRDPHVAAAAADGILAAGADAAAKAARMEC